MTEPVINADVFPSTPLLNVLVRFGIIPIVIIFYITVTLHFEYTPDSTYVYLQYANHLADGEGFSFNQDTPSYGFTAPLWVGIISAGALGGLDPYIAAKTLDLVFASLSLFVLYFVGFAVLRSKIVALAACSIVSFDAWMLQWAGSGMETSLGILLSLLAIWYVYRNDYILASFVCAVFTLVRPEGAVLFVLIQIDNFVNSHEDGPAFRVMVKSMLLYVAVLLPWIVTAILMFGTVVPNTIGASLGSRLTVMGMLAAAGSEVKILGLTQAVPLFFLIVGIVMASRRMSRKALRLELFPLFWIVSFMFLHSFAEGHTPSRSLLIVLPETVVVGLWGMKKMQEFWKLEWRRAGLMLLTVVLLTIAQNQFVFQFRVLPNMKGEVRRMNDGLRPVAYWLREHGTTRTSVLTPEVGLIGYIAQVRVLDPVGLITPGIRGAFQGMSYPEGLKHGIYESIAQPDFVLDRSSTPDRLASRELAPVLTKEFADSLTSPGSAYYTLYRRIQSP